MASREFALLESVLTSRRGLRCFGSLLGRQVGQASNGNIAITISGVRLGMIRPPATAAHTGSGLVMSMLMHVNGRISVPMEMETLGYPLGRDEILVEGQAVGASLPDAQMVPLASTLVSRAESQPH